MLLLHLSRCFQKTCLNKCYVWYFLKNQWHSSGDGEDQTNELDLQTYGHGNAELEGENAADEEGEGDEQLEDLEPFQGSQGSPLNDLDCSSESPTSPTLPPGRRTGKIFLVGKDFLKEANAFQDVQAISRHFCVYFCCTHVLHLFISFWQNVG